LLSLVAGIFLVAATLLPTSASAAGDCLANPAGVATSGKHWYYRLNRVTQQKCWYLGMKRSAVRSVALQRSSKPPVASKRLPTPLPPSIADAQASIQHAVNEATARNEFALSEAGVAKEVTYEDLLRSTFGSRWADPVDTARPTGFQSGRRSLAVAGFEARSFEAADRLVANASSPADALGILLAAAGSALVLLGLCGRLFLAQRDQSSTPEYPTPLHLPNFKALQKIPLTRTHRATWTPQPNAISMGSHPQRLRFDKLSQAARALATPQRRCSRPARIAPRYQPPLRMNRNAWLRRQSSDRSRFSPE
jgi:hypothetical protein